MNATQLAYAIRAQLAFGWALLVFFGNGFRLLVVAIVLGLVWAVSHSLVAVISAFAAAFVIAFLVALWIASTSNVPKKQ